jgi:hypothetical protein
MPSLKAGMAEPDRRISDGTIKPVDIAIRITGRESTSSAV